MTARPMLFIPDRTVGLVGRHRNGKTVLALREALACANTGDRTVLYVTDEMDRIARIIAGYQELNGTGYWWWNLTVVDARTAEDQIERMIVTSQRPVAVVIDTVCPESLIDLVGRHDVTALIVAALLPTEKVPAEVAKACDLVWTIRAGHETGSLDLVASCSTSLP